MKTRTQHHTPGVERPNPACGPLSHKPHPKPPTRKSTRTSGPVEGRCRDLLLQCPLANENKRVEYSKCVISTSTKCLPWNTGNHKNPKPYYSVKCGSKLWIPVGAINNKRNVIGQHILWSLTWISYMRIYCFVVSYRSPS